MFVLHYHAGSVCLNYNCPGHSAPSDSEGGERQ